MGNINMHSKTIAIVTQPLSNNYGGLLQNFALQQFLKKMKFQSMTIDVRNRNPTPLWRYLLSWGKTFLFLFIPKRRRNFSKFFIYQSRRKWADDFISVFINTTKKCNKYSKQLLIDYGIDIVIVGSDQVWRPKYNCRIEDSYLRFAGNIPIKRIAYAASFGVDNWEYSLKQTRKCSELAQKFDAIGVREETGVKLCKENLDVDAAWVLDPTLLLMKEDYLPICKDVPVCSERYLAVYLLDEKEAVKTFYEKEANTRGLVVKKFYSDLKSTLTVPEWLAMFRDASYVVTDSFHGTVFSIIFGKEFKCMYNKNRGITRLDSLLGLYNSGKLEEMRIFSINWLRNALEK